MPKTRFAIVALFLLAVIGIAVWVFMPREQERRPLGLMTSLPIYWSEADSFETMLAGEQEQHWARVLLEESYSLEPLDTLSSTERAGEPTEALAALDRLLLAQPNAMPPADLVALDNWLRGGGRALILADPMSTEHSDFALGDRRRPQDVAMIDPLLARWGLALHFDPKQPTERREVPIDRPVDGRLPVQLAGSFVPVEGDDVAAQCTIAVGGLMAQCAVGKGRVTLIADAALLDREDDTGAAVFADLVKAAVN